jgi:general secretion pathway protein I
MSQALKHGGSEAGFTLIEVLVSLVIFSVAILGLTQAGSQSLSTLNQLEERSYASIIADNQLALTRLRLNELSSRTQTGEAQAGGRDFEYRISRVDTPVPNFFELVVTVSSGRTEQVLIERRAFVTVEPS